MFHFSYASFYGIFFQLYKEIAAVVYIAVEHIPGASGSGFTDGFVKLLFIYLCIGHIFGINVSVFDQIPVVDISFSIFISSG